MISTFLESYVEHLENLGVPASFQIVSTYSSKRHQAREVPQPKSQFLLPKFLLFALTLSMLFSFKVSVRPIANIAGNLVTTEVRRWHTFIRDVLKREINRNKTDHTF